MKTNFRKNCPICTRYMRIEQIFDKGHASTHSAVLRCREHGIYDYWPGQDELVRVKEKFQRMED